MARQRKSNDVDLSGLTGDEAKADVAAFVAAGGRVQIVPAGKMAYPSGLVPNKRGRKSKGDGV